MREKAILSDRNILFTNSCSHFTANLAAQLCELGANIMIADKETKFLERFQESFNEQREIYPHFGRIALLDYDKSKEDDRKFIFQKASEVFGGVNCWIDFQTFFSGNDIKSENFAEDANDFFTKNVQPYMALYKQAVDFLKTKRSSAIIRLVPEDLGGAGADPLYHFIQSGFQAMQNSLNYERDFGIRFLNIKVGPTEDYLLARYPNKNVNDALSEYQSLYPQAELVDAEELSTTLAFLVGDNRKSLRISNLSLSCS